MMTGASDFFSRFPLLDPAQSNWCGKSPEDKRYNCIAFALDENKCHWWPTGDPGGPTLWPANCAKGDDLASFHQAFATFGYVPCTSSLPETGVEKVAIFEKDGVVQHAAKQTCDLNGWWKSKMGVYGIDIIHVLEAISGGDYGRVATIMSRPALGAKP